MYSIPGLTPACTPGPLLAVLPVTLLLLLLMAAASTLAAVPNALTVAR